MVRDEGAWFYWRKMCTTKLRRDDIYRNGRPRKEPKDKTTLNLLMTESWQMNLLDQKLKNLKRVTERKLCRTQRRMDITIALATTWKNKKRKS